MKWIKVEIKSLAPYATPWRADTLWGRLTWLIAQGACVDWTLDDWLQGYKDGDPPLVLSDGFPKNGLPVPLVWKALHQAPGGGKWPDCTDLPAYESLCKGQLPAELSCTEPVKKADRMHVSISRETNASLGGQLWVQAAEYPKNGRILIFARLSDALAMEDLKILLDALAVEGWGKRRSVGYGAFEIREVAEFEPPNAPTANGFVALSHFAPSDDLPAEGFWRWSGITAKPHAPESRRWIGERGQEGEYFGVALRPGACFKTNSLPKPWYGKMLTADIPDHPDYLHYGLCLAWPMVWPEESRQ